MAAEKIGVESLSTSLRNRGWRLKGQESVHKILQDISPASVRPLDFVSAIEKQLLDSDLKACGAKFLPDSSSLHKLSRLEGPLVLQVQSVNDISQSSYRGKYSTQLHDSRLLRVYLTDGHTNIMAIEYHPIPLISEEIPPGTKVCIQGAVPLQCGILLLESSSLKLLGGCVQALYEEWEVERKYSSCSLSMFNPTHTQTTSGPPPFQKLQIDASPVRDVGYNDMHDSSSKPYPSRKGAMGAKRPVGTTSNSDVQGKDSFFAMTKKESCNIDITKKPDARIPDKKGKAILGTVRPDYEMCHLKTSQPKPEVISPSCLQMLEGSTVRPDSERNISGVLEGNEQIINHEGNTILKKQNEVRNVEEYSQNRKLVIAPEAVPVQNHAAARKLLRTMTEKEQGKDFKSSKFRKARGRHHQQETVLTLDEWEHQKGSKKTMLGAVADVSEDEKLARELQRTLDLEASNVDTLQKNEAENIRMSIFNFGNVASGSENHPRKTRGRGRGRRRF